VKSTREAEVIILRHATVADARVLLQWRNDPATMAAVGQVQPIGYEAHVQWLGSYGQAGRHLYVAYWRQLTVGTGRIDKDFETAWLSWTVAPEHRGRGYGRRLIKSLMQEARVLGYRRLGAKIRASDSVSLKLARECQELSVIWVLP